jgi:hypothetical protein
MLLSEAYAVLLTAKHRPTCVYNCSTQCVNYYTINELSSSNHLLLQIAACCDSASDCRSKLCKCQYRQCYCVHMRFLNVSVGFIASVVLATSYDGSTASSESAEQGAFVRTLKKR